MYREGPPSTIELQFSWVCIVCICGCLAYSLLKSIYPSGFYRIEKLGVNPIQIWNILAVVFLLTGILGDFSWRAIGYIQQGFIGLSIYHIIQYNESKIFGHIVAALGHFPAYLSAELSHEPLPMIGGLIVVNSLYLLGVLPNPFAINPHPGP